MLAEPLPGYRQIKHVDWRDTTAFLQTRQRIWKRDSYITDSWSWEGWIPDEEDGSIPESGCCDALRRLQVEGIQDYCCDGHIDLSSASLLPRALRRERERNATATLDP
jgi:hypothetical protein